MKLFSKPAFSNKEFRYHLGEYESAVQRFEHWSMHPAQSEQTAGILEKSSEEAKIHLNYAFIKYFTCLNIAEKSPRERNARLKETIAGVVAAFTNNGLEKKTAGNKGKLLADLLHRAVTEGYFSDLKHNPEQGGALDGSDEEKSIEFEYRNTVSHLFQNAAIASDVSSLLAERFDSIGQ